MNINIRGVSHITLRMASAAAQSSTLTHLAGCSRASPDWTRRQYAAAARYSRSPAKARPSGMIPRKRSAEKLQSIIQKVRFPGEVGTVLRRLGFVRESEVLSLFMSRLLAFMRGGWPLAGAVSRYTSGTAWRGHESKDVFRENERLLKDPNAVGQVFHQIAIYRLPPHLYDAEWFEFGRYGLALATELGCHDAALRLWQVDVAQGFLISGGAWKIVEAAALKRRDPIAMALYLRHQLDNPTSTLASRDQAYVMAKDLFAMVEPSTTLKSTGSMEGHDAPWRLLRDAADQRLFDCRSGPAHQEARETLEFAITQGATKYNDPEACHLLSELPSTEVYSDNWLELKTKSAMNGDADDCFQVAKYWLETSGSYPSTDKSSQNEGAGIGLDWLELAAVNSTDNAQAMASRYLALALLFREAGLRSKGFEWLGHGITQLRDTALDESDAKQWIAKLVSFEQNWDTEFGTRASSILGPPILNQRKLDT